MHYGVRSANVVSNNAQFSAAFKEQQAICGMFDHVQSNRYVRPRWLWYFANSLFNQRRGYRAVIVMKIENPIYSKQTILIK